VAGLDTAKALCRQLTAWLQAAQLARARRSRQALQKAQAEQKARSLLLNLLSHEQHDEFEKYGYFHVTGGSSGDRYRIRRNSGVNVDVLGNDGSVNYHLCARPSGDIPMYDVMAGQLLFLQDRDAEAHFLQQAKKHVTLLFPAMLRE
jgi:hypothetical protein